MPAPRDRDLERTRERLTEWFEARLPDASDLRLSELTGPGTTGFSNDTLMFDLQWREAGEPRREARVARIQPTGFQVFPEYDLGRQFRVQQMLALEVPTAPMYWLETDPSVLGAPFYIMGRVSGCIPTDNPPYHAGGWMTEVAPEQRAAIWWSGLDVLARIHRLDWRALGFGFLDEPHRGKTPIEQHLHYYREYLAWAMGDEEHPTCTAALAWLEANRPREEEPVALFWGDARIGNMIFRGGQCVAVLDWEMVTLGNPEEDLAWWLFLDRHHSEGVGAPRLAGFPSREETLARYQQWSGVEVRHLDYYERFAALRFSVIMARLAKQMKARNALPSESDFEVNNPCSRLLARLMGLPDPAGGFAGPTPQRGGAVSSS